MQITPQLHSIAPSKVIRGNNAWETGHHLIASMCQTPMLIGRSNSTYPIRKFQEKSLQKIGVSPIMAELKHDCCEEDLERLNETAVISKIDGIIASGGGKVLDAGKLLAHRLQIPCITVPLSASTCAGWTALSNIYSSDGAFMKDEVLKNCPSLLIFDHKFVRLAPRRTLASGIADAIAKWYESSVSSGSSNDGLIQQAVQMARVLRDQLLIDGLEAYMNPNSNQWVNVAEGCALTAGIIGGIGGVRCRTVAAHAVHNGLTQIPTCNQFLHGEKVAYGILVQLRLEETLAGNQLAGIAKRQLIPFFQSLSLPVTLEELSLNKSRLSELKKICQFTCNKSSDLHNLPFKVSFNSMLEAILETEKIDAFKGISESKLP